MSKKLLALYGLKRNPFAPECATENLHVSSRALSFASRVEQMSQQGGFAALTGDCGLGKSCTLRVTEARLLTQRELGLAVLSRPQTKMADFYRELGDRYGVQLNPHNRWGGTKALRQSWLSQRAQLGFQPVLLIDEAQEMRLEVLSELRLLCSAELDARPLLTVVLCGDNRLADMLRSQELRPLQSRLRVRLHLEPADREELLACLQHVLSNAGAPSLMTPELQSALCEHAAGNYRVLMTQADELLHAAAQREAPVLDEKLFFEVFSSRPAPTRNKSAAGRR
jgi:general secretion pathway protein A